MWVGELGFSGSTIYLTHFFCKMKKEEQIAKTYFEHIGCK